MDPSITKATGDRPRKITDAKSVQIQDRRRDGPGGATKAFPLSDERRFVAAARTIVARLDDPGSVLGIGDLHRIRSEAVDFIRQAEAAETGRRRAKPAEPRPPKPPAA